MMLKHQKYLTYAKGKSMDTNFTAEEIRSTLLKALAFGLPIMDDLKATFKKETGEELTDKLYQDMINSLRTPPE